METQIYKQIEKDELIGTTGGNWGDIVFDFIDLLIDYYPSYVDNGCPGVYNSNGCDSIGMGLSGNTAFTGY